MLIILRAWLITAFMNSFLHQASFTFTSGYGCYDHHHPVRLVIMAILPIVQITQSGLSFIKVIYYSAQLFSLAHYYPRNSSSSAQDMCSFIC